MDFNEKLREARKEKGITQQELADMLFVSRTAVSKWESGRGYPNIESLKAIAKIFNVTVDELLSGDEMLTIAQEESRKSRSSMRDVVFALLDISVALFFFLPLFGQATEDGINEVSLLFLTGISGYMKAVYFAVTSATVLSGIVSLALQGCEGKIWMAVKNKISLVLNFLAVMVFVLSPQPYAAAFLLAFLAIKVFILVKRK